MEAYLGAQAPAVSLIKQYFRIYEFHTPNHIMGYMSQVPQTGALGLPACGLAGLYVAGRARRPAER